CFAAFGHRVRACLAPTIVHPHPGPRPRAPIQRKEASSMYRVRSRCRRLHWAFAFFIAFLAGPRTLPPAAAQASDAASAGQWSSPMTWPCVAINLVLLPTGKVIFWPRDGDVRSWDPLTGAIATVAWPGHNIFCTGQSLLADGRILLAGGAVVDGL